MYFSTPTYAEEKDFFDLVSIIVDEDTYSNIKTKLIRYSRDIQANLKNTRVVILPTPSNANVIDIASLNESLFFEWYKWIKDVDFESRLVGTILVGRIPIPIVFDEKNSSKSILPYVDFEEKSYIFNQESKKYEKNTKVDTNIKPEIWHGLISPNTWNIDDDTQALKDYFDKNHDFYTGKWVFNQNIGVIDGTSTDAPDAYEPYVFYYDQFRESSALQYQKYIGYQSYLQNIEDITYNRYSKELAEKIKNQVLGVQNQDIQDLLIKVDPEFDLSRFSSWPDIAASSDIMTRYITNNATNKFLEIFNSSALGNMRKYIYNAGRYNKSGSKVNVDMPPFLITVLDQVSSELIKNVNNSLEKKITDIVANGLSQKIAIPLTVDKTKNKLWFKWWRCSSISRNFYFGKIANSIESAKDCSIYRGSTSSGTLVEANRWYNINLTSADTQLCGSEMRYDSSSQTITRWLSAYWWGNTPINLKINNTGFSQLQLWPHDLKWGIKPVFDILWAKKIQDTSKVPSPLDCFSEGVFLTTYKEKLEDRGEDGSVCVLDYQAPVLGKRAAGSWSCQIENIQSNPWLSFREEVESIQWSQTGTCAVRTLILDKNIFKEKTTWEICRDRNDCSCPANQGVVEFKTIPSYILHTSPTDKEFGAQTTSLFTPSLPIDKNRYIDFIGAKWWTKAEKYGYRRIDFPKLFQIQLKPEENLSFELIDEKLKNHLQEVSDQINSIIRSSDPSSLTGVELEMYNALKTGDYPTADIDLYQYLQEKPLEIFTIDNQSKQISYYDTLVFAIYWNNLTTISSKYKFIFKNYLSNQFQGNNYSFPLPRSKKSYETAYFAAPGDAQNMYIKLDPEMKGTHPYADILSSNLQLQSVLMASTVATPTIDEGTFKCAPPDGVNIFAWIPAIICWLSEMLPPTIKISQWSCWDTNLFLNEEEKEELLVCEWDVNKNGINDCIEGKLTWGSLLLKSDAWRYYYNSPGNLISEIRDKNGELVTFDNASYINYTLQKVEIPLDSNAVFSQANTKLIYDSSIESLSTNEALLNAQKYISFTPIRLRAQQGRTKTYFYGKWYDANIYFSSNLQAKDSEGNIVIDLRSNSQKVQIRWDQMFVESYLIWADGSDIPDNTVGVSSDQNFFITDGGQTSRTELITKMGKISTAKEKLLLSIRNYSRAGNVLDLNYPLKIEILLEGEKVFSQEGITESQLSSAYPLFTASRSGRYELSVIDATNFKTYRTIEVLPDTAKTLDAVISTNIVETGGNISTHLLTILDQFNNPATGEVYTVEMSIDGWWLVFDTNGEKKVSYNIIQWYKAFRLRSTDIEANNTLKLTLKNIKWEIISETSKQIRSIRDIQLQATLLGEKPKVWGGSYKYQLSFVDSSWNILSDLNSRAYLVLGKLYGIPSQAYTQVVWGRAEVEFQTLTLAAKNIPLEFQLEGGNEIYKEYIDILPDLPIKIDLNLSKSKMEASVDDSTILQAVLKDRYNNDVFTDSETQLRIEIPSKSQKIIKVASPSKTVSEGKTFFEISGTDIPGIWYFKVSSIPDLGANTFELLWQAPFERERLTISSMKKTDGSLSSIGKQFFKTYSSTKIISKFVTLSRLESSESYKNLPQTLQTQISDFWKETNKLIVSWIGENAGSVETFFFWDKKDIDKNAYNALYSVLLGAPYWDVSKEDYLAGALLFDRNNSSLAVTSLLNSPYKFYDVFSLEKNGLLSAIRSWDITQDIEFYTDFDEEGRLTVEINNAALSNYIGKIYYNIDERSDISVDVEESLGYSLTLVWEDAIVKNPTGKIVFIARESWRFERKSWIYVELDTEYIWPWIQVFLKSWEDTIGRMRISWDFATNITRDTNILKNKLSLLDNTLVVYLHSNQYSSREEYSDTNTSLLKFYYQDPFADKYSLNQFHNTGITGIESSYDEAGIWWEDSNTMLLSFSSGESVWEATKNFQSFSLINLWDPVASLKALKTYFPRTVQEKSFDQTVWKLIENEDSMIGYQVFDYNNDDRQDILTIQTDGYLKLFENTKTEWWFLKQRSLVYAADGGSVRLVKTWDFTWDGYDDIFFVSETGIPEIFNNVEKDFTRYDIANQFSLSGSIIQAESFDMDADGKDDIVTLDDAGEIHIFYGWWTTEAPVFTKKFIGDGYAIKLSETTISHGWAIYYDGLTQIDPNDAAAILRDSEEYLTSLNTALADTTSTDVPTPEFIDESLVNSFIYQSLPYIPTSYEEERTNEEIILDGLDQQLSNIGGSQYSETFAEDTVSSLSGFLDSYGDYVRYSGFWGSYNTQTYFLRSQYADIDGLEIKKTFTDTTAPYLQTWDTVYLDISIKNTSNTRKNNIAYVDSLPKFFKFSNNTFEVLTQENTIIERKPWIGEYDILVDGFYLDPGEETILRFEITTLPLSYGHMQVGLYEKWEVGDDIYGDIVLKENNKNCWKEADIYRSVDVRSYIEWKTAPSCDAADINIWNTFPELVDKNENGIPDYLENLLVEDKNGNLIPTTDNTILQKYADGIREDLGVDSDGDGIPDRDDVMDNFPRMEDTNGDGIADTKVTDFMDSLSSINGAIDEISEDIDTLIQWLSCWFGGGSCFANPLNWAPLAPGNDPTLFGMPIGDGLRVNEWIPIFSSLTGIPGPFGACLPSAYPMSSLAFPGCIWPGAGGSLGATSPGNFVRMFATPTLTGWAGIAVCFGGPAMASGYANPPWVHPIVPGGNCIVAAMPLFGCEGGEWDPGTLGYPYGGDFTIINANCDGGVRMDLYTPQELWTAFVRDYLEYLRTWVRPATLYTYYEQAFTQLSENWWGGYSLPSEPLITIGWGGEESMWVSVDLDTSALASWNFEDVIQIKNKRVSAFPGFLMDWVERQLDEITSKLTNLPKVFVILPDFWGVFDFSWENFGSGMKQAFEKWKAEKEASRSSQESELQALRASKIWIECSWKDALRCKTIDLKIASVSWKDKIEWAKETLSWIKEVYEFIWNIPLVNVELETINVNVPWIDPTELDRFWADWEYTLEQWKDELSNAKDSWSFWATCNEDTEAKQARCEQENNIKQKAFLETQAFIVSLERNIQILQEYKEFPEKLSKLINIKEIWLEQILCNINAISSLMWEWIGTNGERFKAWVELYMLIKAILKSWQLLIDVFTWYEEECQQCKNERQDLQNFVFKLISAIIPSPPIIQFPKWPDIILDLHNIRAGLTIYLPDFEMNLRPIVLPTLPKLHLPDVPDVSFSLPELPTLPRFTIPELPDLPTLPTIELPDLPPPPKIPKIFGAVEGILNIIKLVTKVMCILKSSPFVPEWRAGDQIAFLTERNGYLPTDFINIQPPAFSYSMISAIKVTTYVNFEFEMEFIIEAVKSITAPLDKMTNNIVNMFNISLSDISLVEAVPEKIDVNIDTNGDVDRTNLSFAPLDKNPEGIVFIAALIAKKSQELIEYLVNNNETLSNKEFLSYVGKQLSSESITSNPRTKDLQNLWNSVYNLTYSKEEKFTQELQKNNTEKFEIISNIINAELEYSKKQQKDLKNLGSPTFVSWVEAISSSRERIGAYNTLLEQYNIKTLDAATKLVQGESSENKEFRKDIEKRRKDIMAQVRSGIDTFSNPWSLLANSDTGGSAGANTCNARPTWAYQYRYEGIYVMEYDKNYKLFDYIKPLRGDEEPTIVDIDNDGDDDVLYLVKGKLYLKENRKQSPVDFYVTEAPLILKSSDNVFYNGDRYYESINGFVESWVSDEAINVEFQKPTNPNIHNFRMVYNTIVDKYMDERKTFIPKKVQTHIVDAISDIASQTLEEEAKNYRISKNLATLSYAGAMSRIKLTTEKWKNIKEELAENTQVTLTPKTVIYAGKNPFRIEYTLQWGETQSINVEAYKNISFTTPALISSISGDAYVSLGINEDIEWTDLIDYIWKPLLSGAKISYLGNKDLLDESSHVDISYYDGSEIQIDYRDISSYRLYDLWENYGESHRIRLEVPNDFYYARIRWFKENIEGTWSRQILLAPQKYSDTLPPQIGLNQKIQIPVYQSQIVDLTPYIYEDGWLGGIRDVRVDFDLTVDSDGDGNSKNDADRKGINIIQTAARIAIEFGPYDILFKKKILIALVDDNGNIGQKEINFEVYPPAPQIESIEENIISWQIDETLLDEPIRLYRYRGGVIEKLQKADGGDLVNTDIDGNYNFETTETSTGLILTHSGSTAAIIDEYTGRIDLKDIRTNIRVLPSNNPLNTSVYPELQVLYTGVPIFKQFIKIPERETQVVSSFDNLEEIGTYMKVLDQDRYNTFRVPLGVPYNPGSVSVYLSSDTDKKAIMTVFRDGRIEIKQSQYKLEYRIFWEEVSLVLVEKATGTDITQLVYHIQASYIVQ